MKQIFLVYEQTHLMSWKIVKAFEDEQKAKNYCEEQNKKNNPEFDDWGYVEGVYHNYFPMELE
jgi:hypothetical protein